MESIRRSEFKRCQRDIRYHLSEFFLRWKLKSNLVIVYLFTPQRQFLERGALPFATVFTCNLTVVIDTKVWAFFDLIDVVRNCVHIAVHLIHCRFQSTKFIHHYVIAHYFVLQMYSLRDSG